MAQRDAGNDISSQTPGTPKGEERVRKHGREPGREDLRHGRAARDATSINPSAREPIYPRMPHLPPP